MKDNLAAIILAAGKSTRMKSEIPKVLHPVCGRAMIGYVLDLVKELKIRKVIAAVGYKQKEVRGVVKKAAEIVVQKKLRGTADAVKEALPLLRAFKGTVLVLYGDAPLLKKETVNKLIKHHIETGADATILTATLDKPDGYGRILRDRYSSISGIVEDKDADDYQKDIREINTGIICFKKDKLSYALRYVKADNHKKEYYLTDTVSILYKNKGIIESVALAEVNEALGVNSRQDLAMANKIMRARINQEIMLKGITIIDPDSAFISYGTKIGQDTVIYPFTVIGRNVTIGKRCHIGPFIHLREGTRLGDEVTAGNFLEITRSRISSKTQARHFCYLGDSRIGRCVNIGAGVVTANFDGKNKNITVIGDNAFVGSDTVLVAPVKIGRAAKTGAGAVVTRRKNVPAGAVVVGVPARILKTKRHK